MNKVNSEKLKMEAKEFRVSPPETAWFRLESRLEKHRSQKKIKLYKYLSYAAVLVTILGMVTVFSYSVNGHKGAIFSSEYMPFSVSDLENEKSQGIYNIAQLHTLKVAYQKLGSHTEM